MEVSKNEGYLFGGSHKKDFSIWVPSFLKFTA